MKKLIHVACNIDSKYTQHCGVLLVSLFENNKDVIIKVHILGYELTENNKNSLIQIVNSYNNDFEFYEIDKSIFKKFPISEQWPIVIYFRLLLPEYIDKTIEKILYFDCDIIFRGSIKELFELDMQNKVIGAVEDVLSPYAPMIEECAINMECELTQILDTKSHEIFIGNIVETYCDDKYITNGKVDLVKVQPFFFSMYEPAYWSLGEQIGKAWSIGKDYLS